MIKKIFLRIIFLLILPISSYANDPSYLVTGAGFLEMNGIYVKTITMNGSSVYVHKYGSATYGFIIYFTGTEWLITNGNFDATSINPYTTYYKNVSTSAMVPLTGWISDPSNGINPAPGIQLEPKTLTFNRTVFVEKHINDGTTTDTVKISYNKLNGDIFSGINGENFVASTKILVENVPPGMTANILRNSDSTLVFTLTGAAINNNNVNDITDLSVQFKPEAFVGNDTVGMIGAFKKNFSVNFREIFTVGSLGADFTTIQSAVNGVTAFDILDLAAETFTEVNINVSKPLVITGQGADKTIVQAHEQKNMASGRVITTTYSTNDEITYLKNITVRNGNLVVNNAYGAGITAGSLEIYSCAITDNTGRSVSDAQAVSGGIRATTLKIYNSLINGNTITNEGDQGQVWGGGLVTNDLLLVNSTVSGNYSSTIGGGMLVTGKSVIINSTITNNISKVYGAGATLVGRSTIINSIISGNIAPEAADVCRISSDATDVLNVTNSIISVASLVHYLQPIQEGPVFNGTIKNLITGDPMLGPLADNGGPTYTHALSASSVAIDNSIGGALTPLTDQRGYPAIDQRDLGAFEFGTRTTTAIQSNNTSVNILVYPNPSKGLFHISQPVQGSIIISNLLGKEVAVRTMSNDILDLTDLSKGMYMLNINVSGNINVVKILIE